MTFLNGVFPASFGRGLWFLGKGGAVCLVAVFLSGCTLTHPSRDYLPARAGIAVGKTITVERNENVYTVAQQYNVSMREVIVLNQLKPPYEIKAGQRLILPAEVGLYGEMPPPAPSPFEPVEKRGLAPIVPQAVSSQELPPPSPTKPEETVQAWRRPSPVLEPHSTAVPAGAMRSTVAPSASSRGMRWPVQGPILSSFGPKGSGMSNDGVNIGAPKGAPVVAAASGSVVYAGNEMKGFGNLVLIRHDNDLVTAYAHLGRVLVKKHQDVAQGAMIGTVGKTGNVASPQLHFEVRRDGKPVDPEQVIGAL